MANLTLSIDDELLQRARAAHSGIDAALDAETGMAVLLGAASPNDVPPAEPSLRAIWYAAA